MQGPGSLTEGSISRGMFRFALPILLANILQSLNGSINSIWVGRYLGEAALTATSIANTVMFLLIGAAFGVAMAATILVGQSIGAQNLPEARRVVGTSASFFLGVSVAMAVIGQLVCAPLLVLMKTPADSLALAVTYMRVIFLALPCLYMYAFVMSVLRGAGDARTPALFMVVSVAFDIALNPVFIFGLGPFPRLGIAGSALATFVSQAISLTALLIHLYRRKHMLALHGEQLPLLRPDWHLVGILIKKGIPMSAQMLVLSLSGVIMISIVNRFGVDTSAAYGASLQLWNYIQMPAFAVAMAVSAMAAQNVGAGKWDRVTSIAGVGVTYATALTGSVILLLELLDFRVYALYLLPGSQAMQVAEQINHIATPSFVFFGVTLVLFGVVRATGAVIVPLIVVSISLFLVRLPLAEFLMDRFGVTGVWMSYPASAAFSSLLAFLYYRFGGWRSGRGRELQVPLRQAPQQEAQQGGAE